MKLEERIEYYNLHCEEDTVLPPNVSYQDFFDLDMLDFLNDAFFVNIPSNDWINLFEVFSDSPQHMNKLIELLCSKDNYINKDDFNTIMNNSKIAESFIEELTAYINKNSKIFKISTLSMILNNDNLLNRIFNNDNVNINNLSHMFQFLKLSKERILLLLKDQRFLNILINYKINEFLYYIESKNLENELTDIIQSRISHLSYEEKLSVVRSESLFNPNTGQPKYLQELYSSFLERINLDKIRSKIISLDFDSSSKEKEEVRLLLNTFEGMNIFLKEVLEPKFSEVINILNLDSSFYQKRKEFLLSELNNYSSYNLDTVKNILCIYCFEDNYINIQLRLKTLIEYARDNSEVLLLLEDYMPYLIKLYSYLTSNDVETSPLDLLNNMDLNDLVQKAHNIFSQEMNKKTDITDILNSNNYKEINGVKVIDMDIPLDRSYFIVHSLCDSDIVENLLESYQNAASEHNRICTSILDNNHINTFLDGLVFGYCNITAPIYSAVPFDGQSSQRYTSKGKPQYRSILSSIDRFLRRTTFEYNEITYMTNSEVIMPSYIFVSDREPNELEYKVAKEFNIPIFIYHVKHIEIEVEEGYSNPEAFIYEKRSLDYIPNESNKEKAFS